MVDQVALEALNGGFDTEEFYIETRLPLLAEDFFTNRICLRC